MQDTDGASGVDVGVAAYGVFIIPIELGGDQDSCVSCASSALLQRSKHNERQGAPLFAVVGVGEAVDG